MTRNNRSRGRGGRGRGSAPNNRRDTSRDNSRTRSSDSSNRRDISGDNRGRGSGSNNRRDVSNDNSSNSRARTIRNPLEVQRENFRILSSNLNSSELTFKGKGS